MDPNDDLARDDGEFLVGLCISGTRGSFAQGTRMIDVEMAAAIRLQEPGEDPSDERSSSGNPFLAKAELGFLETPLFTSVAFVVPR